MPKRTDLKSILIIGAGPIVIGQACEFDYSGVQACKALREEGFKIILINSNPANKLLSIVRWTCGAMAFLKSTREVILENPLN